MNRVTVNSQFTDTDIIVTKRLILRKMRSDDAEDMYEYSKDSEVTRYLTWDPHPGVDYTRRYLESVERAYKKHEFYDFALVLKKNLKMIGSCGYNTFDWVKKSCEIGYVLNPRYRGCGIMPEAVEAVIQFAFERFGVERISARFMKGNDASLRVLEKCGMTLEGYEPNAIVRHGIGITVGTCSITRNDYLSK